MRAMDEMANTVENILENGNALLLMGVKCIGKTTKLREYCYKHDYELRIYEGFQIETDFVGNAIDKEYSEQEFGDILNTALTPPHYEEILSEALSHYEPSKHIIDDMKNCLKQDKITVLAFKCNNPGKVLSNMAAVAISEMIVNNNAARISFPKDKLKIALICDISINDNFFQPFQNNVMRIFKTYRKTNYDFNDVKLALDFMENMGYHPFVIEFLKAIRPEKFIECMKSVYNESYTQNSSSFKSIHKLSDFLLEDKSKEIRSPMLLFDDSLKNAYKKSHGKDENIAFKMAEAIAENIVDWSFRTSVSKYPGDDSPNSLRTAAKVFEKDVFPLLKRLKNENKSEKDGERREAFKIAVNMMNNFLNIDDNVENYRKKVFSNYVDKEFANVFTMFYNMTLDQKMRQARK